MSEFFVEHIRRRARPQSVVWDSYRRWGPYLSFRLAHVAKAREGEQSDREARGCRVHERKFIALS